MKILVEDYYEETIGIQLKIKEKEEQSRIAKKKR